VASGRVSYKGFVVAGIGGERAHYLTENKMSEAILLLADKLDVPVSVGPTDDEDEAIEILKKLDIVGLNAFAKQMEERLPFQEQAIDERAAVALPATQALAELAPS
jgi:hypothetical protein